MVELEYFRYTDLPKPAQAKSGTHAPLTIGLPTQVSLLACRYACWQSAADEWRVTDTYTGVGIGGFRSKAEASIHATSLLIRNMMHS